MASNTLSSATCGLCSELYTDPRMLQCLHSFCLNCLKKHFEEQEMKSNAKCPTCKKVNSIPEGGVEAIHKDLRAGYEAEVAQYKLKVKGQAELSCDRCIVKSNGPAVSFCCNCCEFLCKICTDDHQTWRKTLNHELVELGKKKSSKSFSTILKSVSQKPMYCQLHEDETLKYYCLTCGTLICRDCADDEHADHKRSRMEKVAEKEKKELLVTLDEANSVKAKLEDAMAQGEKAMQRVQAKQKAVDEEIKNSFKAVYEAVRAREADLLAKSAEIALGKRTALSMQYEKLKSVHSELSATSKMITEATKAYTPAEMLSVKGAMTSTLQDTLEQFKSCNLEPCKSEVMQTALNNTELVKEISSFGVVTGGCYPAGSTADIYIPSAVISKERKVVVTACDIEGKEFPYGGENVHAELSLMGSRDPPVIAGVVDKDNGTYEVTFAPQICGEHELAITISGEAIKASPFIINVRQEKNYACTSGPQIHFSCSSSVRDVAIDDNGDVYVAVYGYHCVSVFNKGGSNIRTIGTAGQYGSEEGQFYSPSALAIRESVLYVAEESNNRVQKMTTSGKFLSKFGTQGSGAGQLNSPHGICLDPDGRVFVSEYSNNRVSVFNPDGTFVKHITGNLNCPWGLAFDPSGNLHVASYNSNSISVFTPEGTYVTQYGSGVIQYPAGIAINEEGYCFIGEYYGSDDRLFVLDASHKLINTVQMFYYAAGVALNREGSVYIADDNNCRVSQYW